MENNMRATRKYAKIHLVSFNCVWSKSLPDFQEDEDYEECPDDFCPTSKQLSITYNISDFQRGDIIVNSDMSGERSDGVWFWDGEKIIEKNTEYDDYGSPPKEFTAIDQFPPDYWSTTHIGDKHFYWHSNQPPVFTDEWTCSAIMLAIEDPKLLIELDGSTWLKLDSAGHQVNLIEVTEDTEKETKYIYACVGKYHEEIWEKAREMFPNLRSISTTLL